MLSVAGIATAQDPEPEPAPDAEELTTTSVVSAYFPLSSPVRYIDTRIGTVFNGGTSPVGPGGSGTIFNATGGLVPAAATAVAINITALNCTAVNDVRVYPRGGGIPTVSTMNPTSFERPRSNEIIAGVGIFGDIVVRVSNGTCDILGDIVGYFETHNHADDRDKITEIQWGGSSTDSDVSFAYEFEKTIGTFSKIRSDSLMEITVDMHGRRGGTEGTAFCDWQVRVDGADEGTGDAGRMVMYGLNDAMSSTTVFSGLSTGNHTVALYLRGNAPSCSVNFGKFTYKAIAKEIRANSTSVTSGEAGGASNGE